MVKTLHFQCRVQSLVGGTRIPYGVAKTQIPCTRENGHQMRSLGEAPFHVKGQSIRAPGIGKTQTAHSDIPDCLSFVSALHFLRKWYKIAALRNFLASAKFNTSLDIKPLISLKHTFKSVDYCFKPYLKKKKKRRRNGLEAT